MHSAYRVVLVLRSSSKRIIMFSYHATWTVKAMVGEACSVEAVGVTVLGCGVVGSSVTSAFHHIASAWPILNTGLPWDQ